MSIMDRNTVILVVDDMSAMRKIVKTVLRQVGYVNFLEAENGSEGYRMLKSHPEVGLVLSDWNMPKTPGIEFLKMVRADEQLKTLPFILITAEAKKENIVEALQAGVTTYIVKPFTAQTLKEKLIKTDAMLAQRRAV